MRFLHAAAFVAAIVFPQFSQAQSLDELINSWTRLAAIRSYCPKFFRVDVQYVQNMQDVFEEVAGKAYPGQVNELTIRRAGARRDAEVIAAGPKAWCAKWRSSMRKDGTGAMWP